MGLGKSKMLQELKVPRQLSTSLKPDLQFALKALKLCINALLLMVTSTSGRLAMDESIYACRFHVRKGKITLGSWVLKAQRNGNPVQEFTTSAILPNYYYYMNQEHMRWRGLLKKSPRFQSFHWKHKFFFAVVLTDVVTLCWNIHLYFVILLPFPGCRKQGPLVWFISYCLIYRDLKTRKQSYRFVKHAVFDSHFCAVLFLLFMLLVNKPFTYCLMLSDNPTKPGWAEIKWKGTNLNGGIISCYRQMNIGMT